MSPSFRALASLILPAVVLSGLTGCGSGDRDPSAAPSGNGSAAAVTAGPLNPDVFVDDLLEAIDAESSVHLSIDAPGTGTGEADADWSGGTTTVRVAAQADLRGEILLVIADRVVYVEQGDGMYSVIDENDPSYGPLLENFQDIGPHDAVEGLRAGISSVVEEGLHEVAGTELRRYRVTVDPSKAQGAFKALAGSSGMSEAVDFRMYVDENNLLRRVEATLLTGSATVTLDDWSEPVAITVPRSVDLITSGSPAPAYSGPP